MSATARRLASASIDRMHTQDLSGHAHVSRFHSKASIAHGGGPNRRVKRLLGHALAVLLACTCAIVRADCADGTRQATPAEIEFATRAHAALAASLPATPIGMERFTPAHDFKRPIRLAPSCRSTPPGEFGIAHAVSYHFKLPKEEIARMDAERQRIREEVAALQMLPPDKAAQHRALTERSRAAYDAQPRTARGGQPLADDERKLAEHGNAQGKALDDQARAIKRGHEASVKPKVDALLAREDTLRTAPQRFDVRLSANVRRFPAPGDAVVAFGSPAAYGKSALTLTNIVLEIAGPPAPAKKMLFDAIDRSALAALVGKEPPTVAQSEAAAIARQSRPPASMPK